MRCRDRVLAALFVLAAAMPAAAAEPSRDLASMDVREGAVVYVRAVDGVEREGRFVRASSQQIVIAMSDGRESSIEVGQIARVWKRGDRLRNGAIIGAIIGLASAVGGQSTCSNCSGAVAVGIVAGVPIWAGIGALIDRQHAGRTLIYQAP